MKVLTTIAVMAGLIVNIAVIVMLAVGIQHRLDTIANIEAKHCQLIRQSLILGIEQNHESYDPAIFTRLLQNFQTIDCAK